MAEAKLLRRANSPQRLSQVIAILAFPASLFILGASDNLQGVAVLIDTSSAIFTLIPALTFSALFKLGADKPIGETLLATGVPLGLIGSYVGVIQSSAALSDSEGIFLQYAVAILLTCALYGGLISSIGYAMTADSRGTVETIIKKRYLITAIAILFLVMFIAISNYDVFLDPVLALLFLTFISSFLVLNKGKKHFTSSISDAAIFTSIIVIVVSLISWFGNDNTDELSNVVGPVLVASLGVMYGTFIYLVAYIVSLGCKRRADINVKKMNWHLMEVNSFLIFLALAPVSLTELTEQRFEKEERQAEYKEVTTAIDNILKRIENLERGQ